MSNHPDHNPSGRAQLRADLPEEHTPEQPLEQQQHEHEAVRTTIVGGRPPGSGKPMGNVPRGIEVLLKKAAIDPQFRELLLNDPKAAAKSIELELTSIEHMMLKIMPADQLAAIIDHTEVPQQQRRVYLGKSAAIMLAVLGGAAATYMGVKLWNKATERAKNYVNGLYTGIASDMPEDRRFRNNGD